MNEVEIHVSWKDDGGKALGELKAKAKKAGGDAGDEWSGSFSGTLGKGADKATTEVDKRLRDSKVRFTKAGEELGKETAKGFEKGAKDVDKASEKVAKRTQAQFNALAFTGLSVGLPAAAAIGAAGVTASLSLAAGGFAALGVVGVAKTDAVKDAFGGLKTKVVNDVQAMSAPLQKDVVGAIDNVGAAWTRLRPQVAAAVQGSAPALRELTGAATDLAENAMPKLVTAVKASGPALQGVRAFAGQAGAGLGDFFVNASKGSQGAKDGFTTLGGTVQVLEGRLGTMFANLANGSQGPLRSLHTIVDQLSGGLVDLTSKGSGALGALQGFSTAGSGAATVVHGLLAGVSALPPQMTQFVGALGATNMMVSKLTNGNVSLGVGFEGLGGKIKAAEGAGGKLKATVSGLAAGAMNPATLATAGLGLALLVMGADAERAASASAKVADTQRNFTTALRDSKGAINDNLRASVAQDLAQKNMQGGAKSLLDFAKQFGVALPAVTSAVTGEAGALAGVNKQLDDYAAANPQARLTVDALKAAIQSKSIIFQSSTSAIAAEAAATDQSTSAQQRNRDAINGVTDAIYGQQNAQLGYRGAQLNSNQALGEYYKVSKDGKATEDQKAAALFRVEQAFAAQEKAAYDAAFANSTTKDPAQKVSEAFAAENREVVNLANSFKGPLPSSMQDTIGKMSATQAQAAGLKIGVNKVGEAVYQLPNGKEIKITGDTGQAVTAIKQVRELVAGTNGKTLTMRVNTLYGSAYIGVGTGGRGSLAASGGLITPGGVQRFAKGGQAYAGGDMVDVGPGGLLSGPGTGTSDDITARVSNGEFVVKASQTRKNLPLLKAINNGQDGFAGGGGVGGWRSAGSASGYHSDGGGQVAVNVHFSTGGSDLEQLMMQMIRTFVRVQGGNVQNVFGR